MEFVTVALEFLILCYFAGPKWVFSQPGGGQSNGHIIDAEPKFENKRYRGMHYLPFTPVSENYEGLIPPSNAEVRKRVARAAGAREGTTAGHPAVYELFENENNPARTTVNAFSFLEPTGEIALLQKTAESEYKRIRYDKRLNDAEVAALDEQANQGGEGEADE